MRDEGLGLREARDSLREEISQNRNENLSEHEVVRETLILNDSLKMERVTERTLSRQTEDAREVSRKKDEVRVVRDTVYIERTDSVLVQGSRFTIQEIAGQARNEGSKGAGFRSTLKWIFWIIIALIGLTITVKVCLLKK